MAKSQNGYSAITSTSGTKNYIIPIKKKFGPRRNVRLRGGNSDSAIILAHWALRFAEIVERPSRTFDQWGWAYRDIRGDSDLSNHASATAIDLNATQHPLGVSAHKTYTPKQIKRIRRSLKRVYKGSIVWGGEWSRPDAMHFEMSGNGAKAKKVAKRLRKTPRGRRVLKANGMLKKRRVLKAFRK